MVGKTILHYRILEELGRGGMGVVYKAEDTKLERTVAIKFLPRHIAADSEERERFKIEAKAAAALNHPNIATIHAIEEYENELFIVMEYIEGRELREILNTPLSPPSRGELKGGVMSVEDVLNYATQIADGLQAAHEKGVVHRDIKSANIMITDKGQVKIMDFGLAKVGGGAQVTKVGTTLGTAAYMSPEQARGEDVDHRTDIWAFGVLLYEMLSGQLPFQGDYEQAVIYAILNEDPEPLKQLRSDVPGTLAAIVQRCLTRDRDTRYQSMENVLTQLNMKSDDHAKKAKASGHSPILKKLTAGGIVVALLLLLLVGYFFLDQKAADLKITSTRPLTSSPGYEGFPSWSPDGTRIAYTSDKQGREDIWVRQISAGQSINITKDHPGNHNYAPSWSPNGDWIAFFSYREETNLLMMPALGGNTRHILSTEGLIDSPPSWSPDASQIVFSTNRGIHTIQAGGGESSTVPFQHEGLFLSDPDWSSNGQRIAFVEVMGFGISNSRIWTVRTDGSEPRQITDGSSFDISPIWDRDGKRILFVSDRGGTHDIWWLHIGENGGAVGSAKALTTGVGVGKIALSADGKLAYEKMAHSSSIWSIPIREQGVVTMQDAELITSENSVIEKVAVSPDGAWLAFDSNRGGNANIWIMRRDGSDLRQVTTDAAHDWHPTWSPDGKRLAFHSLRSSNRDIWVKPVAGGAARQLTRDPAKDWLALWSPKNDEIAFTSYRGGNANVWIVSESTEPRQVTFLESTSVLCGAWSPDGGKIIFVNEQATLMMVDTDTGFTKELTDRSFMELVFHIRSPDQTTLYVAARGTDMTVNLYAISTDEGRVRKLTDFEFLPMTELIWADSDGQRFYLVLNELKSDIWIADLEKEE